MITTQLTKGNRRSSIKRAGFTLVELLVVISIIALLLAILMPALTKARRQAQSVVCRSNLRQIGVGILMYAQNNQDTPPPYYGGVLINQKSWMVRLLKDRHFWSDNPIAYISGVDILFCPAHKLPIPPPINDYKTNDPKIYAIMGGTVSYGMSMELATDPVTSEFHPAKLSQIMQPAATIEIIDGQIINPVSKQVFGCFYVRPYYNGSDGPSIRHNGACDVLWVDGHVTPVMATNPKDQRTIYDAKALTNTGLTPNYWDWK
jgi:prepilin-type N-terminal cleavage/methylation domain-containing protein/prepilin-type processing-associated H-X9-DG protein